MKQLSVQVAVVFLFVAMNGGIVHGMELEAPPCKKNSKNYAAINWKMRYLLEDLHCSPINYAIEKMWSIDDAWLAQKQNRAQLIEEVKRRILDEKVESAVVEKLNDVTLACYLAQEGKITNGIALVLVNNFLQTDITTCFSDFGTWFSKAFPGKILKHGNDVVVYKAFMDAMTQEMLFQVDVPVNDRLFLRDHTDTDTLSTENNAKKYATFDSERNFLAQSNDKRCITIENINNGITVRIVVLFEIAGLGFLEGNATSLGIVRKDKEQTVIHEFVMPLALLRAEIPLQQLAALVYGKMKVIKKTKPTKECYGHTILQSGNIGEEKKLIEFMHNNVQAEWVPAFLKKELERDREKLCDVITLRGALAYLAYNVSMTREELATELYIDQSDSAWHYVNEADWDSKTISLIEGFSVWFVDWYGSQ